MSPKTPKGQTRRQIYRFMRDRLIEGFPPTVREVQEAFGFRSVQTAREHLEILVDEGKLIKKPGVSRGYRLPDEVVLPAQVPVPLLGRVQAGALTTAVEEPDGGYIGVQSRIQGDELFALRVRGESMNGVGILPDDIVIVRKQAAANPGDVVVALVEDEATVKTFRIVNGRPELHAENPRFDPIIPTSHEHFVLLGKVIEIRRYLEM